VKSAKATRVIKSRHVRALNFASIGSLLPETFKSLDAAFGKLRIPVAAREIGRGEFEFGRRHYGRRLRRANYAEGGAREAVYEYTGERVGAESSGRGKLAMRKSTATRWLVSGCTAA
jgi:hypothetical protein